MELEEPVIQEQSNHTPLEPPRYIHLSTIRIWADTGFTLTQSKMNGAVGNEVFCVRYSQDYKYLASGTANGSIKLYNAASGLLSSTMVHGASPFPITCIK